MQASGKSLIDQILEAWFADLERSGYFDSSALERIKHLASRQELDKSAKVISAIKMRIGDNNENH